MSKTSKFFAGSDDDDSDIDQQTLSTKSKQPTTTSFDSGEDEAAVAEKPVKKPAKEKKPKKQLVRIDEEPEDEKRSTKSHKAKRLGELEENIADLKTSVGLDEWKEVTLAFEKVNGILEKAKKEFPEPPHIYLKFIAQLDDYVAALSENKKALSDIAANQQKFIRELRQKVKKTAKTYQKGVDEYKAKPDAPSHDDIVFRPPEEDEQPTEQPAEEPANENQEEDLDEETASTPAKKKKAPRKKKQVFDLDPSQQTEETEAPAKKTTKKKTTKKPAAEEDEENVGDEPQPATKKKRTKKAAAADVDEEAAEEEVAPKKKRSTKKKAAVDFEKEAAEEEPAPKKKSTKKKAAVDFEEEEPAEEEAPAPKKKKSTKAKSRDVVDFEEEEPAEEEAPAPKKKKSTKKKASDVVDFEEEEPAEEEAPKKKKSTKKSSVVDWADDEDDEEEGTGFFTTPKAKSSSKATANIEWFDDDDEEPEQETKPKKKKKVEDEDDAPAQPEEKAKPKGLSFWLKKPGAVEEPEEDNLDLSDLDNPDEDDKKTKPKDKKKDKKRETRKKEGEEQKEPTEKADQTKQPAPPAPEVELTPEQFDRKFKEVVAKRGLKNTDKLEQVESLKQLSDKAKTPQKQMEILIHLISALFDVTLKTHVANFLITQMSPTVWRKVYANLSKLFELLNANPELVVPETEEAHDTQPLLTEGSEEFATTGSLVGFIDRLDEELLKNLQFLDLHTKDYLERLQDEILLLDICEIVMKHYQKLGQMKRVSRIAIKIIEHVYYKKYPDQSKSEKKDQSETESQSDLSSKLYTNVPPEARRWTQLNVSDVSELLERLTKLIYKFGDERIKTRAVLCHIYFLALHNRFHEARDLMLMSRLQESITHMEIPTQILFNRTMVQLGLCAFRKGYINEAHSCLADIYAGSRVKELLAQGTSTRFGERNAEQEKIERRRQTPHHMHINLELSEAVHLISAMLLEVPNMAANAYDVKKKVISRTFRRWLDYNEKQVFTGPPENIRDYVMAASRALSAGDWKKTSSLLLSLPSWNHIQNPEQVKQMLKRKIQEEGLRTWLFANSRYYDSINISTLSTMFELTPEAVTSIVSKMMIYEEIHASLDQPSNSIVLHKVEPSRLQYLALTYGEKLGSFVENNERAFEAKTGNYNYKHDNKDRRQDHRNQGDWQSTDRQNQQGGYDKKRQGQRDGQYNRNQNRNRDQSGQGQNSPYRDNQRRNYNKDGDGQNQQGNQNRRGGNRGGRGGQRNNNNQNRDNNSGDSQNRNNNNNRNYQNNRGRGGNKNYGRGGQQRNQDRNNENRATQTADVNA